MSDTTTILPNSLTRDLKVDRNMSGQGVEYLYSYCASCGVPGPRFIKSELPDNFAFYLCDDKHNNCVAKYGELPGTYMIPDEVFFKKVEEAQLEFYGRTLTLPELLAELDKKNSPMTLLSKERK